MPREVKCKLCGVRQVRTRKEIGERMAADLEKAQTRAKAECAEQRAEMAHELGAARWIIAHYSAELQAECCLICVPAHE